MISSLVLLSCGDDTTGSAGSSGDTAAVTDSTTGDPPVATTTDDPSTTTSATAVDSSSTGPGAACGNGRMDPGEECDDENVDNDDECYSNCTLPFEVLWTETEAGPDVDRGRDGLFDADGNLYVLGFTEVAGQGLDMWLRQYAPDGTTNWTYTYNGATNGDDIGITMAWLPDGDLVLAGAEDTANDVDALLMRFDPDTQMPVWTQQYDGPGTDTAVGEDTDFVNSVTVDIDGNILVASTQGVDMQEVNILVRKIDPDGVEIWAQSYNDDTVNLSDTPDAVITDSNGDIYVAGATEAAPNMSEGWVRKYDTDGNEIWTEPLPGVIFIDGTLDADDNIVLTGFDNDTATVTDMWTGKYDPDFTEIGVEIYDGPSGLLDFAQGVGVGPDGDIYVTGFVTIVGESQDVWVGRHSPDLSARWWSAGYGNTDTNLDDEGNAVVVSDDGTRVAVIGSEAVIGEDANIWVRMYQNNPTP